MVLKVLGSSSKGNGYILENDTEALILECGVNIKEAKKALQFNVRKVAGCCVTHQHNDHAGHLDKYAAIFYTLALPEVFQAKNFRGSRTVPVEPGKSYKLGNFHGPPFPSQGHTSCSSSSASATAARRSLPVSRRCGCCAARSCPCRN